jgi:hypothetical protein
MPFYIQSVHSGKYLDIRGASKDKGTPVIIYDFNGNKNQQWTYKNGRIVSKMNGCVVYERLNISVYLQFQFSSM